MTRSTLRRAATAVVAAVAVSFSACGPNSHIAVALPDSGATLEGTVKYGGEDVHYAFIVAQAADGQASAGKIDSEGRYHIPNVPLGEVRIGVNTNAARGDYQTAIMQAGAMSGTPEKAGRKKVNLRFIDIPPKYIEPARSGLSTTVNKGANVYDIVLPK